MSKVTLTEILPFKAQLTESTASGALRVRGIFQRADAPNKNGRIYPRGLWESILKSTPLKESLKNRRMLGEADHPNESETRIQRASHIVTNLWLESNGDVIGEAEILNTPNGQIVRELIERDVELGISSRGLGSTTRKDGKEVVAEDFELTTFDFVVDPSTHNAYPKAITESRNKTIKESRRKGPSMKFSQLQEKARTLLAVKPSLLTLEGRKSGIKQIDSLMLEVSAAAAKNPAVRLVAAELAEKLSKKRVTLEAKAPGVDKILEASKTLVQELANRLQAANKENRRLTKENAELKKGKIAPAKGKTAKTEAKTSPVVGRLIAKMPEFKPYAVQLESIFASKGLAGLKEASVRLNKHIASKKVNESNKNTAAPGMPPRSFRTPQATKQQIQETVSRATNGARNLSPEASRQRAQVLEMNSRLGQKY